MKKILKKAFKEYIEFHNKEIDRAKDFIEEINQFNTVEFSAKSDLKDFKLKHVLYYFEIPENCSPKNICEIIDAEKKKKKSKKTEFKLPQVNFKNAIDHDNKILYVGKSSGYFSTRLKQHVGNESKQTYALHLKEWNKMFNKEEIKLKLHYMSFQNKMTEKNKHLLEIIETSLHYKLKPILGRTGH